MFLLPLSYFSVHIAVQRSEFSSKDALEVLYIIVIIIIIIIIIIINIIIIIIIKFSIITKLSRDPSG